MSSNLSYIEAQLRETWKAVVHDNFFLRNNPEPGAIKSLSSLYHFIYHWQILPLECNSKTEDEKSESIKKIANQYYGTPTEIIATRCIAQALFLRSAFNSKTTEDFSKKTKDLCNLYTTPISLDVLQVNLVPLREEITRIMHQPLEENIKINIDTSTSLMEFTIYNLHNQVLFSFNILDDEIVVTVNTLLDLFEKNLDAISLKINFKRYHQVLGEHIDISNQLGLSLYLLLRLQMLLSSLSLNKSTLNISLELGADESNTQMIYLTTAVMYPNILLSLNLTSPITEWSYGYLIALALKNNPSITSFSSTSFFVFDQDGADEDAKFSQENTQQIGNALLTNNTLTSLDLYAFPLNEQNYKLLCEVLSINRCLTSLTLTHYSPMNQRLLATFAEVLLTNPVMKDFRLGAGSGLDGEFSRDKSWDWISSQEQDPLESAKAFSILLRNNTTLTCLETGYWKNRTAIDLIAKALSDNRSLTELTLPLMCINFETALCFLETFRKNKDLLNLNIFSDKKFGWRDTEHCLAENDKETHEDCFRNNNKEAFQARINKVTSENRQLRYSWSGISVLAAFARANRQSNALKYSVFPLLNKILKSAGIEQASLTQSEDIRPTRTVLNFDKFTHALYFQSYINTAPILNLTETSTAATAGTAAAAIHTSSSSNSFSRPNTLLTAHKRKRKS